MQRGCCLAERVLGLNREHTLDTVYSLATVFANLGRLEEAKKLLERALSSRERVLGINRQDILATVYNLASVVYQQGLLEEAKKLHERALSGYERVLGPNHEKNKNISKILSLMDQQLK